MSFSADTKDELSRVIPPKGCCLRAQLAAMVRAGGSLRLLGSNQVVLSVDTESSAVARCLFNLFKTGFSLHPALAARRRERLRKNNTYKVTVNDPVASRRVLVELGIWDEGWHRRDDVPESLVARDCCRRAYLRGAFLAAGFVGAPLGSYHLEIMVADAAAAAAIYRLMEGYHLGAKVGPRKKGYSVYLKDGDEIVEFLKLVGASQATLEYERVRVVKQMRNRVNRLVNCDTANLSKTVEAALRQRETIGKLVQTVGYERLPQALRTTARLRLEYPEASLRELGALHDPPLTKSAVNHRLRRLTTMAEELERLQPGD
ncbi:MAG: DNA-binding protein WhiA [Bacillota bacterium]